jgi:hypothetical protein
MCVKVGVGEHGKGSEAFWVELTGIEQGQLKGIIVNHLSHTDIHGLKAGEQVAFGAACVIAITD